MFQSEMVYCSFPALRFLGHFSSGQTEVERVYLNRDLQAICVFRDFYYTSDVCLMELMRSGVGCSLKVWSKGCFVLYI